MTTICQSCGTQAAQEARFCRKCGAPLRPAARETGDGFVSPQAATIPLRDDAGTRKGLADDESGRAPQDASRASRDEADSASLRNSQQDAQDPFATIIDATMRGDADARDVRRSQSSELRTSARLPEEDLLKTRASVSRELDEEATLIAQPRYGRDPFQRRDGKPVPTTGPLVAPVSQDGATGAHDAAERRVSSSLQQPQERRGDARKGANPWVIVLAVCSSFLLIAALGTWLAVQYTRKSSDEAGAVETPPVSEDRQKLASEKVAEAESARASGDTTGALSLLREATSIDPNNARAHRRLGDLLWETGARREAIESLRRAAALEQNDFTHWRALASAQLAEGLPADAAASFRRVLDITGQADLNDLLSYAHALRLSGRTEEARVLYERLAASPDENLALAARQNLSELAAALAAPTPQQTDEERDSSAAENDSTQSSEASSGAGRASAAAPAAPTPAPTPSPRPTPQATQAAQSSSPDERYRRGLEFWRQSNRQAALSEFRAAADSGNVDAHYYVGLSYVEGKEVRSLGRSELLAALRNFQVAQRGSHAAQARRYAQQLENEYDRRRNQ